MIFKFSGDSCAWCHKKADKTSKVLMHKSGVPALILCKTDYESNYVRGVTEPYRFKDIF